MGISTNPERASRVATAVVTGAGLSVIDDEGRLIERLDASLASVFALCDGGRSIAAMAALLESDGDVEGVCAALDDLYDLGLLARRAVPPAGSDRVRRAEVPLIAAHGLSRHRMAEFGMPAEQSAKVGAERSAKASAERNAKSSATAVEQAGKMQEKNLKGGGEQHNKAQERNQKNNIGSAEQTNKTQAAAEHNNKIKAGEQNAKQQAQSEQKQKRGR